MKLLTLVALSLFTLRSSADVFSLAVQTGSKVYNVPTNVVATVTHMSCSSAANGAYFLTVSTQGLVLNYYPTNGIILNLPSVAGPATITVTGVSSSVVICTMKTDSAIEYPFTPSQTVVVPNDAGGPVTVGLESSTDMVNWVGCQAGTYSTSATNRFFRVKASR